jgi:hypothetical protein
LLNWNREKNSNSPSLLPGNRPTATQAAAAGSSEASLASSLCRKRQSLGRRQAGTSIWSNSVSSSNTCDCLLTLMPPSRVHRLLLDDAALTGIVGLGVLIGRRHQRKLDDFDYREVIVQSAEWAELLGEPSGHGRAGATRLRGCELAEGPKPANVGGAGCC